MNQDYDDQEMLEAIRAGGSQLDEVMRYIYQRSGYRTSILAFIQKRNGSAEDAEDIFQDGISQLIMNVRKGQYEGRSSIRTYLTTICKNLWYTRFSRTSKHKDIVDSLPTEMTQSSPEKVFLRKERSQKVQDLLSHLGEKCKDILSLWSLNYSMKEIAETVGYKSQGMAKKKKHQCFQKLMGLVKGQPKLVEELIGSL